MTPTRKWVKDRADTLVMKWTKDETPMRQLRKPQDMSEGR
jgi:hypothetical protein